MTVRRLTAAQATLAFLENQFSERDGEQHQLLRRVPGNFWTWECCRYWAGSGTGFGTSLLSVSQRAGDGSCGYWICEDKFPDEDPGLHELNRSRSYQYGDRRGDCDCQPFARASAARDIFARRNVAPVLQQLESPATQDISVNDCFKPVSRYWDRIYRPEQLLTSLPEAMRVLTSPDETGAVTICFPQDVQTEAFDFPDEFFRKGLGDSAPSMRQRIC